MEEVETEIGEGASAPPVQPDAIAVVVSVFVNGKAVPWPAGQANASFTELTTQRLESKSSVEVVTAYKMIHLEKSKADWKDFLIPPVVADVNKHLKTSSEDQKDRYQVQDKPKTNDKPFTKFDSREVQRKILQRFTVENDVSKKRMLAMTRSLRETRFLFHASDTALFYGIEWDFFLKETPFKEVWENTIQAQIHHSENSETVWDNSIRYALAIMMGTRGISINTRLPHELVRSSLDVLFRATSPNGLFNGRLDEITKEPALFSGEMDRDFYFRATFEIPYIFLTHGRGIQLRLKIKSEKSSSLPEPNEMRAAPHSSLDEVVDLMMTAQPKRHSASTGMDGDPWSPTHSSTLNLQGQSESLQEKKATKTLTMKKSMPFNSLVDQSSIVELDEEWLYNYPPFFTDRELTDVDLKEEVGRIIEPTEGDASGAVVTRAAHAYIAKYDALTADENVPLPEASFNLLESINPDPYFNAKWAGVKSPLGPPPWASHGTRVWIADVLEQKSFAKQQGAENVEFFEVSNNLDLWKKLASPRTSIKAKKRFIWLPDADHEMALVCCLTSPSPEKAAVSLFFDRHAHYENFFSEKTTMIYNTWESELHLSFYRLVDESYQTTKEQIPESSILPLSSNEYRRVINELEGTTSLRIRVLQNHLGNIQSLRETLKTSQEQLRDDIGFYGAENIRFFTYVTAVFLPLGFAASIFSMSEEPPEGVLRPMVICSVIALVLTFVALANAKRLNAIVKEVSMFVTRYSLSKMSTSPLMAGHKRRKREQRDRRIQHAEEAKVENPSGSNRPGSPSRASRVTKARDEQISWWFWFWLAYFFIEFPARRVLVAYRSLSKKEVTKWTTYVHVIIGVLILPVFIVSFILQLLVYNVVDFAKYLWEALMQYMESHDPNETKNFERHLNWLTYPMDPKCRPFKGKLQELKKSKDEASSKAPS
ncbi:hypothetical protein CkaCkLH20_07697 [Colletotrichum karsti]|uniref:CorA-like Mg2+ transporter n=1 Tax=Colletotrichum karsti TaxID=1095194 RepID=A0A9P6I0F0_9PEZI|nr:uncharacterized protein CkaCkLH20_07697 [Colletotrichum karsti]KAF9875003.1 hypothetical protein CkaCkLH20_07697 [Colletotrichum karsti]